MSTSISETTLPNGMKIFYLNKKEVDFLYEEMPLYFKHGIELHEGDTVFDVGANIGMFTLLACQLCKNNVNIYAFEPIPAIFEVLRRNVQRFNLEKIKVFPCGLSENSKSITFAYYPNASVWSTIYMDEKERRDSIKKIIIHNLKDAPSFIGWFRWLPQFLRLLILDKKLEKAFQMEQVTCKVRTLSEIIREYNVQQIDLLKVDVEKSELDVILGIEEQDWPKIKQVVIEVHDLDHRVENMTALLKEHGLSEITVEQEPIQNGTEVFSLYALRRKL